MLTWLADTLRADGLHVIELADWKTRSRKGGITPEGVVCHNTATGPNVPDSNVRALLRDGRSDLPGPLAQLGLERPGTWVVVAAGRCNHNGYGQWGNDSIGVEAYNDGRGEPWPEPQLDAYARGVAAICRRMGWGPERVKGHKETDPDRKIDPTFDMDLFRSRVFREDDMFTDEDRDLLKRLDERETKRNAQVQDLLGKILAVLGDDNTDRTVQARLKETLIKVRGLVK